MKLNQLNKRLLDKICIKIANNFGDYTAKLYYEVYKDKSTEEIIASVHELADDYMGSKNAEKQFADIFNMK